MSDQINELKNIFEYEIKRKLAQRARSTADEFRILMNGFKFYDYDYTGKVNQNEFVKGILRTGLSGFNESDIRSVFNCYDINNTGYIDYKNFCDYLYGREPLKPLINSQNEAKDGKNVVTNEQSNQKQKTPITNNQRKTPINQNVNINNNISDNSNQNAPGNQNQIQQPQVAQNQQNIDSAQTKEYFQKLIFSFKEQINTNNGLTYYTFLFELKNTSDQNKNVSLDNFVNVFKTIGLNIPQNDIINFFNLLDFSGTGKISIDDIMNTIVDPMNEHRKLYVVNKFAKMDVEKQGEVKVALLKEKYNPKGHPDVMSGKTNEEEIFKQFCYTLDIYCNIRMISDIINYKQFIDYYDGISSSIPDEKYFEDILNGVWDDSNLNNNNIENNLQQENNNNTNNNVNNNMNNQMNNQMNNNMNKNMNNNMNDIFNMNNNAEFQTVNNNRYNNQQNTRMDKPANNNFNSSYCDENIGINSLFLGEPTHVLPKSFAKKNFKRQRADFNQPINNYNNNLQYKSKQRMNINNNASSELPQNNNNNIFNRNNNENINKAPISQSQAIKINQNDLNQNQNQNQNDINANYNIDNNRQKRLKITYNPITNEYTPINYNNNNNMQRNRNRNATPLEQMNLNNLNNPNNIINNSESTTNNTTFNNQNPNNVNNVQINNEEQIKDIVISSLDKLKNSLIFRGTRLLFSFQRKLSIYDLNHQGLVSLDHFLNIVQAYTMSLSEKEAQLIFDLFDKDKKGVINYNEFMQTIAGPINPHRQTIIEKVFEYFNKDKNGKVSINEIKVLFNPRGHPDVINGKRSEGEILGEFLDNIESFKEYLENLYGNYENSFSLSDFVSFYNEVGIGIEDDKKFEFMMYNCWNLSNNLANNMNNYGGNKYRNTGSGFRGNNSNNGNLMARAGSEIINNKGF
jgi:Ca2+-binding EF-hand superfamily protein